MNKNKEPDIIIIGGGPIGLACALAAEEKGLSYLILEKGCLVNSLYHYPANMTFFSTSELLEIGSVPFVSINPKPTRPEALEYYRRVAASRKLHIHLFEKVEHIIKQDEPGKYTVETTRAVYHAKYVIIATGFYDIPNKLNISGEELHKVKHYYDDPHYYAMQKVIVVGANNSSVDAALQTWRKGADVTMVIRGDGIGKRVKYWKKPDIENRIKEGSIKAYYHSYLTEIREDAVDIQTPEGRITLPNDYVLAMTGYHPNFSFLKKAGVHIDDNELRHPYYDPETMETNRNNLFLAGVVCGGLETHIWFIENSRQHADKILSCIEKRERAASEVTAAG